VDVAVAHGRGDVEAEAVLEETTGVIAAAGEASPVGAGEGIPRGVIVVAAPGAKSVCILCWVGVSLR
jgi:hypothetical protein